MKKLIVPWTVGLGKHFVIGKLTVEVLSDIVEPFGVAWLL